MVVPIKYPALDLKNTEVTWLYFVLVVVLGSISSFGFKEDKGDMVVPKNYPLWIKRTRR